MIRRFAFLIACVLVLPLWAAGCETKSAMPTSTPPSGKEAPKPLGLPGAPGGPKSVPN
jgi:hypothetical protein